MAKPWIEELLAMTPEEAERAVMAVRPPEALTLDHFAHWALDGQTPPSGGWRVWAMIAGRGFGKTRAGAEWVLERVREAEGEPPRFALVAATLDEASRVMVEGPSGLIAADRGGEIVDWSMARRTLRFNTGAQAFLYSGASPESLRGPEHDFAWCDEFAKWTKGVESWDMLQFGMRRGVLPRILMTTTPRPGEMLGRILTRETTARTGGHSGDNVYLPPAFIEEMEARYGDTRLGRQELAGEIFAEAEGALWTFEGIARQRAAAPVLSRIAIGVDPPASASGTCGIVVCGKGVDGLGYVIEDASLSGQSPEGWARAVATAASRHGAHVVVAEANQGGAMVESVLRAAAPAMPVMPVHARAGKAARAEPVAALFTRGRAWFAGTFPELEAELVAMAPGVRYSAATSPDRADAMVWAMATLMLGAETAEPRVRVF